jgi:hypothetical protein
MLSACNLSHTRWHDQPPLPPPPAPVVRCSLSSVNLDASHVATSLKLCSDSQGYMLPSKLVSPVPQSQRFGRASPGFGRSDAERNELGELDESAKADRLGLPSRPLTTRPFDHTPHSSLDFWSSFDWGHSRDHAILLWSHAARHLSAWRVSSGKDLHVAASAAGLLDRVLHRWYSGPIVPPLPPGGAHTAVYV